MYLTTILPKAHDTAAPNIAHKAAIGTLPCC